MYSRWRLRYPTAHFRIITDVFMITDASSSHPLTLGRAAESHHLPHLHR